MLNRLLCGFLRMRMFLRSAALQCFSFSSVTPCVTCPALVVSPSLRTCPLSFPPSCTDLKDSHCGRGLSGRTLIWSQSGDSRMGKNPHLLLPVGSDQLTLYGCTTVRSQQSRGADQPRSQLRARARSCVCPSQLSRALRCFSPFPLFDFGAPC